MEANFTIYNEVAEFKYKTKINRCITNSKNLSGF
jgi:hypothetical protein